MVTHRKAFICGGDFYANSTLWGCRREDLRIDLLNEHLVIRCLASANLHNTDTTFGKLYSEGSVIATGWPDLTLTSSKTLPKSSSGSSRTPSVASYIHFTYHTTPLYSKCRRLKKTNFRNLTTP